MTFGDVIAEKRKTLKLSQKQLAQMVTREDGKPISPQYLNDIERDRRNPPSEHIIEQFAKALKVAPEYLYLIAKKMPPNLTDESPSSPEQATEAFKAFAKAFRKGQG